MKNKVTVCRDVKPLPMLLGLLGCCVVVWTLYTCHQWILDERLEAAVIAHDVPQAKSLLARGANPNLVNEYGVTLVSRAAYEQDTNMVHVLLDYKADPNLRDRSGQGVLTTDKEVPLHPEIVIMLKQAGAVK